MARVIEGINGAFRGKVGTVVGYTRNGVGIMRSLPKKSSKAPSQEQLDNRKKMKVAQAWLKFLVTYVRVGFKNYSQKQHGFGSALSYLKLNAINEDFTVDPAKVLISCGELAEPMSPAVHNPEPGVLEFTWEPVVHDNDHAIVVAHAPNSDKHFGDLSGAKRSAGVHIQNYPGLAGEKMHVYLGFVSQERDKCSNSVYLGMVTLK
ncbi:MAG: DUF6266 family protein [Bacteroidota bacterium]